jgi:two-component system OmpR family response regulator
MRILLVEDDLSLACGLVSALGREGFVVNHVTRGNDALAATRAEPHDIVVLDLGLPDMDGLEVLGALRDRGDHTPVLLLTARGEAGDKVVGLDRGADDYLAKPFDMTELAARLRVFASAAHAVTVDGESLSLPRREYMLLKALMESAGKVLTRSALENRLYSWGEEVASNALEVHIHHLRRKLPEGFIRTVRGIGYSIAP